MGKPIGFLVLYIFKTNISYLVYEVKYYDVFKMGGDSANRNYLSGGFNLCYNVKKTNKIYFTKQYSWNSGLGFS